MSENALRHKHILIVSQYYNPEPFRINDIAAEWAKRGHKVTVLTGIPNYPEGVFYKGYGFFKRRRETVNDVDIIRIPLIPRGHSSIGVIINYFSFMISGVIWKTFTKLKPDSVFIFAMSPMTQAIPAVKMAKRRHIPCTIYVQDLWPENLEVVGGITNKFALKRIDKMVNKIYRGCTNILVTSPSFKKHLESRASVHDTSGKSKVIYWPQYAEEFYKPVKTGEIPEDFPHDDRFKLIFTGNIGFAQGLDILPEVSKELKNLNRKCDFVIVGDGRYMDKLKAEIRNAGAEDYFFFTGRKPATDIPKYLGAADTAFISFAENELFNKTIPAKLQSYMACGMPILAAAGGETQRIVEEAKAGFCSPAGDAKALSLNLVKMMDTDLTAMGEGACSYATEFFNKSKLMDEIEEII